MTEPVVGRHFSQNSQNLRRHQIGLLKTAGTNYAGVWREKQVNSMLCLLTVDRMKTMPILLGSLKKVLVTKTCPRLYRCSFLVQDKNLTRVLRIGQTEFYPWPLERSETCQTTTYIDKLSSVYAKAVLIKRLAKVLQPLDHCLLRMQWTKSNGTNTQ